MLEHNGRVKFNVGLPVLDRLSSSLTNEGIFGLAFSQALFLSSQPSKLHTIVPRIQLRTSDQKEILIALASWHVNGPTGVLVETCEY